MDGLTLEKIRHISSLSMIRLSAEEEMAIMEEVNSILEYFVAVTGFKGSPDELKGALSRCREDGTPSPQDDVSALILDNFPKKQNRMLVVPRSD